MTMTTQQLISAAEHAARYVPPATAQLITALVQTVQHGEAQLPAAITDIISERQRQQSAEGWTPEHDNQYTAGELLNAAASYIRHIVMSGDDVEVYDKKKLPLSWPWHAEWWKPTNPRRDLVKAAALIAAEIERIDRTASKSGEVQS